MNNNRLLVTDGIIRGPAVCPNTASISITGLKDWIFRGKFFLNFFRYQRVTFLTYSVSTTSPPFFIIMLLRLLSRDECFIQDASGMSLRVTARLLVEAGWRVIRDLFRVPFLLFRVYSEVKILSGQLEKKPTIKALDLDHRPLYLRTDLCATLLAGGSVTHISGVLNNLDNFVPKPLFLTSDTIPMVRDDIEKHIIRFNEAFWDFPELPLLNFNQSLFSAAESILEGKRLSFIYQRYSHFNYSGVKLSKRYHVPLVLEYNGSEAWVSRHWGSGVIFKRLSAAIELLNLRAADLVVVVSRALKDELISRGILPDKILVNPNGVDTEKYHPAVEGAGVRELYKLKERIVFGFIGTFGKWHGAEVLIEAFGLFLKKHPEYRERVRLLMIGDGVTMSTVKARIKDSQLSDSCILTGIVPQKEGPRYLAACDILVSPHVPNPDGSPFFGSPTKLFEYMAMGKPIIASSLGQIGEVLKHDETAWLVEPKDAASLMNGIKILLEDEDRRRRLGLAARREAESKYTWKQHTGRIINALKSRLEEAKEREEAGVFSPHLNILPHSAAQEIIREAEKNCRHIFDLLGSGEVYLGEKINWHVDFKNSYSWEAAKLYRDIEIPYGKADIKVPWELSRFQHVAFLAEAYLLSGDEKYTNEFTDQVDDWINNNPPGRGVNWACAMDVAIRACNWITGYHIFKHSSLVKEEFLGKFLMSMRQHGRHIMANLEYSPFVTSNHYLSDIAGLIFIGVSFPQFEESKRWKKFAVKELIKEMDKQVYEDGCDFEASTCYHRLSLELFFFAVLAVARAHSGFNGGNYLEAAQTVFGRQFMRKLFKMFDATSYLLKPNGRMPQIGDNDSGRLFTLFPREILDHRYILALGAVFFRESAWKIKELFSQDDDIAEMLLVFGKKGKDVWDALEWHGLGQVKARPFKDAGWYPIQQGNNYCIVSNGPNGQNGNGGHCHNDRLSFEWFAEGKDIIVDPGTYVYTQDPQARNRFRSTNLHNTVTIDKEEQNKISLSHLFSMGNELGFKSSEWKGDEDYRVFLGQYRTRRLGGERVIHQREVKFYTKEARLKICDSFEGRKRHALQWNFILSPYLKRQVRSIESEKDFRKEEALYSLAYGKLEKTDKLTMTRETGLPFRIEITLEIRNDILRAHVKE